MKLRIHYKSGFVQECEPRMFTIYTEPTHHAGPEMVIHNKDGAVQSDWIPLEDISSIVVIEN